MFVVQGIATQTTPLTPMAFLAVWFLAVHQSLRRRIVPVVSVSHAHDMAVKMPAVERAPANRSYAFGLSSVTDFVHGFLSAQSPALSAPVAELGRSAASGHIRLRTEDHLDSRNKRSHG